MHVRLVVGGGLFQRIFVDFLVGFYFLFFHFTFFFVAFCFCFECCCFVCLFVLNWSRYKKID